LKTSVFSSLSEVYFITLNHFSLLAFGSDEGQGLFRNNQEFYFHFIITHIYSLQNHPPIMKKCFFLSLLAILMILTGCKQEKVINDLPRANAAPEMVAAIDSFVQATKTRPVAPDSITLHSIMILKHGEVVYEKWFNGHSAETPHPMFSVSKTFTAIAVGLAINEGKLSLTDPVVKFFPDQLPDEPSDYLKAMTVRDLLTMTCGHDEEPNSSRADSVDWVESFLAWPVKHQPGEYYLYNSIGTYMLSAIVQKVTGEKLIDYLDTRLFQPLNINRPTWDESPQGINCGGWGLNIKTEDMAKLGQLFLQKGKWNGKQVVPAEWLKEMSSYQVPSAPSGTRFEDLEKAGLNKDNNEWVQGYGYQMWICRHNAFRADGYAGQYIMVFPDRDAVLVLTTSSSLYQPYIDLIWEFLLPVL
jgi:CubicO group peptidase (beta-lactamase class C family)